MLAQAGCLLWADSSVNKGDLSKCCVSKIGISRDAIHPASVQHGHYHLFPDPSEDEWYARLLSVPLIPRKSPEEPSMFTHPLSLSIYVPKADGEPAEKITRLVDCNA
jgi:hypothetical protein